MASILIPTGFYRIAQSDFRYNSATAYYNGEKYFLVIDEERSIGPLTHAQLEALEHVLKDVIPMRSPGVI